MKKKLLFLLVCAILSSIIAIDLAAEVLGDVNISGKVDIIDSLIVAQIYVGLIPQDVSLKAADADLNGKVEIIDALFIAQYYVGVLSYLPPGLEIPPLEARTIIVPIVTIDKFEL